MDKHNDESNHILSNTLRVLSGLVLGGLVGAGVMLLLAPQSGKRTRAQLQRKGIELRDQASDSLDEAMAQVRVQARKATYNLSDKAEELQQLGQELLDEQKERFTKLRHNGKKALQNARG